MLLRGTISYGAYYLSNELIIGEALDDAAYNHDILKWIGVGGRLGCYCKPRPCHGDTLKELAEAVTSRQ